jgi:hypothetical protein
VVFSICRDPGISYDPHFPVALLGGYLTRASDPPPGNIITWRGLSRLTDIHVGYVLAKGDVGNG